MFNLMKVIEYLLELVALLDFLTDLKITVLLIESRNTMWAALTVNAMIAPLLVCSVQMILFLTEKVIRRNKYEENILLMAISWSSIGPLFLAFLIIMDQVFILNTVVFEPVGMLCACCAVNWINKAIDKSYENMFQMKKHEVSGFRRMRTT